ncbi:hypothetical protein N7463_010644 [Penicillium fimorum]|uniref:Uncharacterized protein n=1 Tax=Penicillium fimorum TaxID=1882269 RepID=A0A9X0C1H7_9EURO|nr:hypothetical protein N7463_010644 [Penicillium fimorum]
MSSPMRTKTDIKTGWCQEITLNNLNDHVIQETPKARELEIVQVLLGRNDPPQFVVSNIVEENV